MTDQPLAGKVAFVTGASAMKVSQSEAESAAIWKGRKSAFGATGAAGGQAGDQGGSQRTGQQGSDSHA